MSELTKEGLKGNVANETKDMDGGFVRKLASQGDDKLS